MVATGYTYLRFVAATYNGPETRTSTRKRLRRVSRGSAISVLSQGPRRRRVFIGSTVVPVDHPYLWPDCRNPRRQMASEIVIISRTLQRLTQPLCRFTRSTTASGPIALATDKGRLVLWISPMSWRVSAISKRSIAHRPCEYRPSGVSMGVSITTLTHQWQHPTRADESTLVVWREDFQDCANGI